MYINDVETVDLKTKPEKESASQVPIFLQYFISKNAQEEREQKFFSEKFKALTKGSLMVVENASSAIRK